MEIGSIRMLEKKTLNVTYTIICMWNFLKYNYVIFSHILYIEYQLQFLFWSPTQFLISELKENLSLYSNITGNFPFLVFYSHSQAYPWELLPTESFTDLDQGSEMIIFGSILTTLEASFIYWRS